jgi:7-cyano-7-deazaguanine synthase in queuosine biosynthesis
MKILCSPNESDFTNKGFDLCVKLFGNSDEPHGYIGNQIWPVIKKAKYNPTERAWDLLSIALSVISADFAGHRKKSPDGWTRNFDITISVSDANFWLTQTKLLEKQLGFLTTDRWRMTFIGNGFSPAIQKTSEIVRPHNDSVVLLSGGLDSFIGIVDLFEKKYRPYAVSQTVVGDAKIQREICVDLGKEIGHLQLNHNAYIPSMESPPSQRARSILFLSYGILLATCLERYSNGEKINLFVCENGFISINPPLAGNRLGSLSTRTTNPYFLKMFQELLDNANIGVSVINPYQLKTKGQMMIECKNQERLKKYASKTTSCGRYRVHGFKHCGRCIPCLTRRAAFLAWGGTDRTTYVYNNLSKQDEDHAWYDDVLSASLAIVDVKKNGLDKWLGATLNSHLLGDVSKLKLVVKSGLKEIAKLLEKYKLI